MADDWRQQLASIDVSNVFIYVGDAVRWDYTPESLLEKGVSCKTISASIHSPTSFATLATGLHPPKHGVYDFTHQISDSVDSLFDISNIDTRFFNSVRDQPSDEDPIFSVLNTGTPSEPSPVSDRSEPFIVMERGPGGHAPYGDYDGTAWDYFEQLEKKSRSVVREEYEQSVNQDGTLFETRLRELSEQNLLSDTLVIYTSDHGEMLGENGVLGHNGPMRPELVEVPTVLTHPEIPQKSLTDGVFRHVDLIPTILDVLDLDDIKTDGESILETWPVGPGLSFYRSQYPTKIVPTFTGELGYDGVWDYDGGHVFTRTHLLERLSILAGKGIRSPKRGFLRRNSIDALRAFGAGDKTYGTPSITVGEASRILESTQSEAAESSELRLSKEAEEQLHDLGYL